jgi:hypothetical protein
MILQYNVRVYLKGGLPNDFDAERSAERLHRYLHGTFIPAEGMTTLDIDQTEPPTVHIHKSDDYNDCDNCHGTAQDREN